MWVTPTTTQGCAKACSALGAGWKHVSGGSKMDMSAMCAGLLDMPGVGQQWLVGSTAASLRQCQISCATSPCWKLPVGATREYDWVTAGTYTSYKALDRTLREHEFPIKCACVNCTGPDCDKMLWTPAPPGGRCRTPTIPSQAGERLPSAVYSYACRSDHQDTTHGQTGWVDATSHPSVCRNMAMKATNYSVWCA